MDDSLPHELKQVLYVDIPQFHEVFFGGDAERKTVSEAFFEKCKTRKSKRTGLFFTKKETGPRFTKKSGCLWFTKKAGWATWPETVSEPAVITWLQDFVKDLSEFASKHKSANKHKLALPCRQRLSSHPTKVIQSFPSNLNLDLGFVNHAATEQDSEQNWSQILVPGELKRNPSADTLSEAWLQIARYAKQVLIAQDARRFVMAFTLCGSLMRVWQFDRLGGIASEQFDINQEGLRFVETILGFLSFDDMGLGFDPTIQRAGNKRFIEIERAGQTERIIIEKKMMRHECLSGQATTCWKGYSENRPEIPLVIKDSWQYECRNEEGEMLSKAKDEGVTNVARYYHHETVQAGGKDDDVVNNVRKGIDIRKSLNYPLSRDSGDSLSTSQASSSMSQPFLPLLVNELQNRDHRRVIVRDYGKPIYTASSRAILLSALEGCIKGHEHLLKAGLLHRDISINNMIINEGETDPLFSSFLIDLDLAIEWPRGKPSGARSRTCTQAFMAIGALLNYPQSFMHDLESFFWVLFWICIHYNGPNKHIGVTIFDQWNHADFDALVFSKRGVIGGTDAGFLRVAKKKFTPYYQPLAPCVNELRRKIFPRVNYRADEDLNLYAEMIEILRRAQRDPAVVG